VSRSYRSQLVRRKYYYPDEPDRKRRYEICFFNYLGDNGLIMLCRYGSDYVVLCWHDVQPGYIPEDKWAGNREDGHELYLEMRKDRGRCIQ
jgi:hypothetical protein